jgi:hypothetical protein
LTPLLQLRPPGLYCGNLKAGAIMLIGMVKVATLILSSAAISLFSPACAAAAGTAGSACAVPPLPVTGSRVINVSSESQLQSAMAALQPGDTIILAEGRYNLTNSLYVNGRDNVTIRGASGCEDVVIAGRGMDNPDYGNTEVGIWSNSRNTTIAHLSIWDTYDNAIIFNAGAQSPHVYSVKMMNIGSQFIKANPTDAANGIGVDNGLVEYSWMEYNGGPPATDHGAGVGYFNGISAHTADNWVIRNNMFKNLHNPDTADYLWNPAVLMWNHSTNTVTEGNVFINVDRAIAYGLQDVDGSDHYGGIIRNNFIYLMPNLLSASRKAGSDALVLVWDSPSSNVYHNTILTNGNVAKSIEFRFATAGSVAGNNLLDAPISSRNGGSFVEIGNFLGATSDMFVSAASGDLHLVDNDSNRAAVIDHAAATALVKIDIDGDQRPLGSMADIGADELAGSTVDTTPPAAPTGLAIK